MVDKKHIDSYIAKATTSSSNPVEPVVSELYATVSSIECLYCECTIVFADHDIGTMCDTIEGQYTEYDSVMCEACGCHNAI